MEQSSPDFDVTRLQQITDVIGVQVDREPDNTAARLRLAWCLLGRALYRAGQESVSSDCSSSGDEAMEELLQKCLHQVMVIKQISLQPHERQEAQMLYSLIGMSSDPQAIQKSDDEENAILQRLMLSLRASNASRTSVEPRVFPRRHHRHQ